MKCVINPFKLESKYDNALKLISLLPIAVTELVMTTPQLDSTRKFTVP